MDKKPKWWTIFEDSSGGFSSMRVMFVMVCVLVMGVWVYVCVVSNPPALVMIPKEIIGLILGFGGVKTFQRFAESKDVETADSITQQTSAASITITPTTGNP